MSKADSKIFLYTATVTANGTIFLKMGHPQPILGLFKQTIQILQQNNVKKCPYNIWCWDSNS